MAEKIETKEDGTTEAKNFSIQKIYTKDISFETPNSPQIFIDKWEPQVDFNLGTNVTPLEDNLYEVVLSVTVTVKCGEKTAYLVEVAQAGVFTLTGFSEDEMGPMMGSFCPNILFPYAREVISDLVSKGGFPQLLLAPVNFEALYTQHLQQVEAEQLPGSDSIN
ncbi:MAG: protein-export chaperone SecB [Methylococcales bacterium]|nr:protein-export chaperone SecB [Methylococcales bacterium]